jgi:Zn-dependent protease with chaperone function
MSLTLLIALATSVPFAGLCWLCAAGIDRFGAGVQLRIAVWTTALCLPVVLIACALMVGALNLHSPLADLRTHLQPVSVTPARHDLPAAPWIEIALAVLAVGAAGRLAGLWIASLRVARAVEQSLPVDRPLFPGVAPVRQTDGATPVLAGFRRPVILMPRRLIAALPAEQVALICAHEQSHLAAGDHIAHVLEEITVRIFWFNPPLMAIRHRPRPGVVRRSDPAGLCPMPARRLPCRGR